MGGETSKDGERWRSFGRVWQQPGEPVLLHTVPRFVRFRLVDGADRRDPLEGAGDHPMTLLRMEVGTREELWPGR